MLTKIKIGKIILKVHKKEILLLCKISTLQKRRVDIGLFCQNIENFGRIADDMIGREELFSLAEAPRDADNLSGAHILACFYVNSGIADEGALFGREAQRREHRKRRVGCRLQWHAVSAADYQIKGIGEEMCNGVLCYSILLFLILNLLYFVCYHIISFSLELGIITYS